MKKIDIKKFQKKFNSVRSSYNMIGFADMMVELFQIHAELTKNNMKVPAEFIKFYQHIDAYSYVILNELSKHNAKHAAKYFEAILSISPQLPNLMFHLYFLIALTHYELGNYPQAEFNFKAYLTFRQNNWQDSDEFALFYLGNCFAYQKNFVMAQKAYQECLQMKKSFNQAAENLSIINQIFITNNLDSLKNLQRYIDNNSLLNVDENDDAACFNIPIFINSRDRVGVLKQQIDWLLDAGYTNIIILDNNSSYKPLFDYYRSIVTDSRIKIKGFNKNLGFKSLWKSNILEVMNIQTPYVYTDPDLVPIDSCPKNFVQQQLKILKKYPLIKKIGLGLVYKDITFFDKQKMKNTESKYYDCTDIAKNLYYIQVDTTFALYVNCRHYNLRFSLRTLGDMMAKHLPWYFDYDNLPDDEKYYLEHADKSSTVGNNLRKENQENKFTFGVN